LKEWGIDFTNSLFPILDLKLGKNVQQGEENNPDDVYEVPVDFCHFNASVFGGRIVTRTTGTP
jgi:hypothetical protein